MPRRFVSRRSRARHARGFTLLETALALMIVLVGVLAIMEAQTSFIKSNAWSSQEATATYLANEIRERMRNLPRHDPVMGLVSTGPGQFQTMEDGELTVDDMDDIDDYNFVLFASNGAQTFLGPIDAFGEYIHEVDNQGFVVMSGGQPVPLVGWSQHVIVEKVDPYQVANIRDWGDTDPPVPPDFPGRAVDDFPLRVTVTVFYQGPYDLAPSPITTMSWVAPNR